LRFAVALDLGPCFTPVERSESNGMADAFVKIFKRDYVRVNPIPDAHTALMRIDHWMVDYNSEHSHSRLGYRSPRELHHSNQPSVRSNGATPALSIAGSPGRQITRCFDLPAASGGIRARAVKRITDFFFAAVLSKKTKNQQSPN
jgi:hypothetical protein